MTNPDPPAGTEPGPALDDVLDQLDRQGTLIDRARESLEETLQGLRLTPDEERAVADEVRQLRELAQKLESNTIEIAAFGMVSRGKSSVLNALLGKDVFQTGSTHGTTLIRAAQPWESVTLSGAGND